MEKLSKKTVLSRLATLSKNFTKGKDFDKLCIGQASDIAKYMDGSVIEYDDLFFRAFNDDYFVIGYHKAEQVIKSQFGVFEAIGIVRDYELDNFGAVSTDLSSSEKVCNMLAYIRGEEILQSVFNS
jgi:hypothetical protein